MLGPLLFIIYIIDFAKASEQIMLCTVRYSWFICNVMNNIET